MARILKRTPKARGDRSEMKRDGSMWTRNAWSLRRRPFEFIVGAAIQLCLLAYIVLMTARMLAQI